MENKGTSIALWVIAIVLVIFLIGGIGFLAGLAEVTAPPEVTVTTGEVTDHDLTTSVKVNLVGEKDSYRLTMTGPEGTEVGSEYITDDQMADGKQSVWVSLVEEPLGELVGESAGELGEAVGELVESVGNYVSEVAAKPGAYSLVVTDSSGNKVYEKTFGPYSGPDLSVVNIGAITTSYNYEYPGYDIDSIPLTVKNDGDLPVYVAEVEITADSVKDSSTIPEEDEAILPGETATITITPGIFAYSPGGDYSFSFKLKDGFLGKTVATYTTTISIP